MRVVNRIQPLGVIPWLWVCQIEKSDCRSAICPDIVVAFPVFVVFVTLAFVMWLVVSILVERVFDEFVEGSWIAVLCRDDFVAVS